MNSPAPQRRTRQRSLAGGRPPFIRSTELIAGITHRQRRQPRPGPTDLSALAAASAQHLAALTELATVMHRQVADQHQILRTDDGSDAAAVLDRASADAAALHASLSSAQMFAVSLASGLAHLSRALPPRQGRPR